MLKRVIKQPLVWIDCEMTGLDHKRDVLIEICCIITDGGLEQVGETFHRVIHQPEHVMARMNEWCVQHHGDSGLTQRVAESPHSLEQVHSELLHFLKSTLPPKTALLAGNSVHMDRLFLLEGMPQVVDFLHYRLLDVSSVHEAAVRFAPKEKLKDLPPKAKAHTAESDILESIAQLRFYKNTFF